MKTFSGTIDTKGWASSIPYPGHPNGPEWARPARLFDLETDEYRILVRFVWRRRPLHLAVYVFMRPTEGTPVLRIGRRLGHGH